MTDEDFEAFIANCTASVRAKNAKLEATFGIGQFVRWDQNGETGILTFSSPGCWPIVEAGVTAIGSYSLKTKTWLWAWANESNTSDQRAKSESTKQLFQRTSMQIFEDASFVCDEVMAWELAAVSVEVLDGIGVYRGPVGHLWIFWSIDFAKSVLEA